MLWKNCTRSPSLFANAALGISKVRATSDMRITDVRTFICSNSFGHTSGLVKYTQIRLVLFPILAKQIRLPEPFLFHDSDARPELAAMSGKLCQKLPDHGSPVMLLSGKPHAFGL
jgi:hypothetical protein